MEQYASKQSGIGIAAGTSAPSGMRVPQPATGSSDSFHSASYPTCPLSGPPLSGLLSGPSLGTAGGQVSSSYDIMTSFPLPSGATLVPPTGLSSSGLGAMGTDDASAFTGFSGDGILGRGAAGTSKSWIKGIDTIDNDGKFRLTRTVSRDDGP